MGVATDRQAVTVDALGGRDHGTCSQEVYTGNIALALEAAGVESSSRRAPVPPVTPADGSGAVVAFPNQVLDRLGFGRFMGSYTSTAQGLSWSGDIFDANRSSIDPTALIPTPTAHAEVSYGAQRMGGVSTPHSRDPMSPRSIARNFPARSHISWRARIPPLVASRMLSRAADDNGRSRSSSSSGSPGLDSAATATYVVTVRNVRTTDATSRSHFKGYRPASLGQSPIQ